MGEKNDKRLVVCWRETDSSANLPGGKNAHFQEEVPLGLKKKENGELYGKLSCLCLPEGKVWGTP